MVEDEDLVGTMVRLNLESAGYQVVWVRNGGEAAERAAVEPFDLILLDISLPGMGGLSVLEAAKPRGRHADHDADRPRRCFPKVRALDFGADDYLAKPFHVEEMLARVNALVRRSQAERTVPADHIVQVGDHQVNLEPPAGAHGGIGEVTLSEKEAALVKLLLRSRGRVLSRSDILEEVWGMDVLPSERTVDNFILRLRKLFEPGPGKSHPRADRGGEGYRFVP